MLAGFILVAAALLPACSTHHVADRPSPRVITGPGADGFSYRWRPAVERPGHPLRTSWNGQPVDQGVMTVSERAGDGSGINRRVVVPVRGASAAEDQSACVTILGPLERLTQPGVALRIRTDGGRTRAITVTNNVLWFGRQAFNVHLADSNASGEAKMHQISGFVPRGFASTIFEVPPPPWRLCARVQGRELSWKVWAPGRSKEPPYTDPRHGHSVQLPAAWVFAGTPGLYVGHLAAGDSTSLGVGGLEQVPG